MNRLLSKRAGFYLLSSMKSIYLLIAFLLTLNAYAQTGTCPPGSNKAVPELSKFEGVWQWTSGKDTSVIVLQNKLSILQIVTQK